MTAMIVSSRSIPAKASLCRLLLSTCLLFLLGHPAFSATTPADTLSFTETVQEKLVHKKVAGVLTSSVVASGQITAKGSMVLDTVDPATFGPNTQVEIRLGDLVIRHALSDDPAYSTKKKAAKLVTKVNGGKTSTLTTTLKWTPSLLTFTVRGTVKELTSSWTSIGAAEYRGQQPGLVSKSRLGHITLNNNGVLFNADTQANIASILRKAKDGAIVPLSFIRLTSGAATPSDYRAPVKLKPGQETVVAAQSVNATGGVITIASGKLAGVSIKVPGGAVADAVTITAAENAMDFQPVSGRYGGTSLSLHSSGSGDFNAHLEITVPFSTTSEEVPVPFQLAADGTLRVCMLTNIDRVNGTFTFVTTQATTLTWVLAPNIEPPAANALAAKAGGITPRLADAGTEIRVGFDPKRHGFKMVNRKVPPVSPGANCFGMVAFAQWHLDNHPADNLYDRFHAVAEWSTPPLGTGPVSSLPYSEQDVIAVRAHTAIRSQSAAGKIIARQDWVTHRDSVAAMRSALANTNRPIIVIMYARYEEAVNKFWFGSHAVLAFGVTADNDILVYDPSSPYVPNDPEHTGTSTIENIYGILHYPLAPLYGSFTYVADGHAKGEPYEDIYNDANHGFRETGFARITITSHQADDIIVGNETTLTGKVESGFLLVDRIQVIANNLEGEVVDVDPKTKEFELTADLKPGFNLIKFKTLGPNDESKIIETPNIIELPPGPSQFFRLFSYKPPLQFLKMAGDGQTANPGSEVPVPLYAVVKDAAGQSIPYARVNWSVVEGDGWVQGPSGVWNRNETTLGDDTGNVIMRWMLGLQAPRSQKVKVSLEGFDRWNADKTALVKVNYPPQYNAAPVYFNASNGCPDETQKYTDACIGFWNVKHYASGDTATLELMENGVGRYYGTYWINWRIEQQGCKYVYKESGFWHPAYDSIPRLPLDFPPTSFKTIPDPNANGNSALVYTKQ